MGRESFEKSNFPQDPDGIRKRIRQLKKEHEELEHKLQQLNGHHSLSPAEQIERKTIQKKKLQKKQHIALLQQKLDLATKKQ